MVSPSQNDTDELPTGSLKPSSTWGEYNNLMFVIQQALAKMQTSTLVRVESCTNTGELAPFGFVDVTPLVNQIDAAGNPTPHVTIYGVPYLRMQGGANAIIIDPEKGDIGLCSFASRDISKVKNTQKQGNPGSFRQFSFSDAIYMGGMLNAQPTRFIQFSKHGIIITTPDGLFINAESDIQGSLNVSGNVTVGTGASGTFTTQDGQTVTVQDGIVTNIY